MKPTRREVLVTIAALAAPSAQAQPAFLTAPEFAFLTSLVDTIIPRTDTPGAAEAGVPAIIDRHLAASPQLAEHFRSGMKALNSEAQSRFKASFPALPPAQQIDLLNAGQEDPFFHLMKGMTIDAYYTSNPGLAGELGWHGNTFLSEFKGCTHPEHQR